jgi:hypothetical protein
LPGSRFRKGRRAVRGKELAAFSSNRGRGRFIEEVRGDEPELAAKLRIEERELEAGGLN